MVSSRGTIEGDEDVLGDGVAFAGVAKYPARVKCALLGWMAFKDALAQASADACSEERIEDDERNQRAPDDELLADLEEAMRDVVDPELGINVVDLGLVYGLNLEEGDEGTVALIDMTLTSAACPLTDVIEDQSRSALVGSRTGQRPADQLGVEPAVGPGQDHRGRPRATARPGLHRLSRSLPRL